jgi:transposase
MPTRELLRRRVIITPAQRRKIRKLVADGATQKVIATELNLSGHIVARELKDMNLETQGAKRQRMRQHSAMNKRQASLFLGEGMSLADIAKELHVDPNTVYRWKRAGEIRPIYPDNPGPCRGHLPVEPEAPCLTPADRNRYLQRAAERRFRPLPTAEEIMNGSRCRHLQEATR